MLAKIVVVTSLVLSGLVSVYAAESPISLKSVAEIEHSYKQADGSVVKIREKLTSAPPGQEVIFTNSFSNSGNKPATNLVLTNPVPLHMKLVKVWGDNADVKYSVDGGKTFALPSQLMVKSKTGAVKPAVLSDYTHIRWTLQTPLLPNKTEAVGFNAVVE